MWGKVWQLTWAAKAALMAQRGPDIGGIQLVAADSVADVLSAMGLKNRRTWRKWLIRSQAASGRRLPYRTILYGASAALSLALLVTGWHSADTPLRLETAQKNAITLLPVSWRPEPGPALAASAIESRPPAGKSCAAIHLGIAVPNKTERAVGAQAAPPAIAASGLCEFRYHIISKASSNSLVWVMATRESATGTHFRLRRLHQAKRLAARGTLDLDAMPPRRLTTTLKQDFVVLALPDGHLSRPALNSLMDRVQQAKTAADLRPVFDEARRQGASILRLSQTFSPEISGRKEVPENAGKTTLALP